MQLTAHSSTPTKYSPHHQLYKAHLDTGVCESVTMSPLVQSFLAIAFSLLLPGKVSSDSTGLLAVGSSMNSSSMAFVQHQMSPRRASTSGVSSCYICTGGSCKVETSCTTVPDAVCLTGILDMVSAELQGCASKSICEDYRKAYSCTGNVPIVGFCCCSSKNCNSSKDTCIKEIAKRCRNGAGGLGGGGGSWALALPLVTLSGFLLR
ncbi:uncharacterized protein LOC142911729 [Petromyzon marinus]|uniref:Uncharacterized protein LOC116943165 n=1 Tax=Petromyzon marinus TaxID=7757 RepID=A0AAJ7WVP2_PETMA|nr:uncharacterized protein LOC116943165 [Petromyzon marinus]